MKNILLVNGAIIVLIVVYAIFFARNKTDLDRPQLSLSCSGNVHFYIHQPDSFVTMKGSVSMTTLGSQRLAWGFSGQLITEQARFILSRTLLLNYLYHPENHILEMNYVNSHVTDIDTVPEDVFFNAIMKSHMFIVKLSRFSENALLVSDATTPLYVCVAQ